MDIMDLHERGIVQLGVIADKLGCDISGSTDDVDLCMVTHCKHPIGYAVLRGNQWSRISEQEFNKFSKPSKHVYIESIDVSLDPDTARLPGYWNASGSDAFQALFQLPELCQKNATLLMLFVLCITAPLLSILYPLFGGSIAVVLTGIQTVSQSPVLQELLRTCGGPEKWKGKHWTATVPHSWQPHRELCAARPSDDLADYAKLKVTAGKKSMTLPAPVVNRLVALENSIPQAVVNTVNKNYPFSVPVVLGRKLAGSERTIFTLDGNELLNYDEKMLQRLFAQHSNIQNILKKFVVHYRKNPQDFAADIERRAARFIPSQHDGRFTCNSADASTHAKAKLLAVLEILLRWVLIEIIVLTQRQIRYFLQLGARFSPKRLPNRRKTPLQSSIRKMRTPSSCSSRSICMTTLQVSVRKGKHGIRSRWHGCVRSRIRQLSC